MPFNPQTGIYENDQPSYFPHTGGLAGVDILNPFRAQQLASEQDESRALAEHMKQLMYQKEAADFSNQQAFQGSIEPNMSLDDLVTNALKYGQNTPLVQGFGLQKAMTQAEGHVKAADVAGEHKEAVATTKAEAAKSIAETNNELKAKLAEFNAGIKVDLGDGDMQSPLAQAKIAHLNELTQAAAELTGPEAQLKAAQAGLAAEHARVLAIRANILKQGGTLTAAQQAQLLKASADIRAKIAVQQRLADSMDETTKNRVYHGLVQMAKEASILEQIGNNGLQAAPQQEVPGAEVQGPPSPVPSNRSFNLPTGGSLTPSGPPAQ